ncbi:MAG: flagellar basal body-associated FliL family protein [Pseudomonadales bacterium]
MADDDVLEAEEQESTGGSKKKLIIIAAAALVLLLAIGGGVYWFFFAGSDEPELAEDGTELSAEEGEGGGLFASGPGKAQYHVLKPKFTTTFEANGRQRYMQVEITLMTRETDVIAALVKHQPLIRNALVLLLAQQDYLELQTMEGRASLRTAAVTTVQEILQQEIEKPGIEQVLFTDFVMQ